MAVSSMPTLPASDSRFGPSSSFHLREDHDRGLHAEATGTRQ